MEKKTLIFLMVFAFLSTGLLAQKHVIRGKIIDASNGSLIPNVNVYLKNGAKAVSTDEAGNYYLVADNNDNDMLIISHVAYQKISREIRFKDSNIIELNFKMEPLSLNTDPVVVTASRTQINKKLAPLAISIISTKEIENSMESSILSLVGQKVPGVFISERSTLGFGIGDGAGGHISIHGTGGFPNTQILMMVDGNPQFMGIFGHPLPDTYLSSDAERVEIIRGPASLLYGSNAMGGVINVIRKKLHRDGYHMHAIAQYGSFNSRKIAASGGLKKDQLSFFVSINHESTDGHRDNANFNTLSGYVKGLYDINQHLNLQADMQITKLKTSDPGPINTTDSSYLNQGHWYDILRGSSSLSFNNKYDRTSGSVRLFMNWGDHDIFDGFHSKDVHQGISIFQNFSLFEGNEFTLGIDTKNYGGLAENLLAGPDPVVFSDTSLNETGAYAYAQQLFFDRLFINGGIRYDNHSIYGGHWIPQAGASFRISDQFSLSTSYAKGYRSPTLRELFLFKPANQELLPEKMDHIDLGMAYTKGSKFSMNLNLFSDWGENMIKMIFTDQGPKNVNTGEFNNKGVDVSLKLKAMENLSFQSSYSYLMMDEAILATPEHQFYLSSNFKAGKTEFMISFNQVNGIYLDIPNEIKENYSLLNARVKYSFTSSLNAYLSLKNLLNQEYQMNLDYPLPGFNFHLGIQYNMEKIK